jgi:hypothetical protein
VDRAEAKRGDAVEGAVLALEDDREAAAHRLPQAERGRAGDRRVAAEQRARLQRGQHRGDGRLISQGDVLVGQDIADRGGRIAEAKRVAGDEDPAPGRVPAGLADRASGRVPVGAGVAQVERVIAAGIPAAGEGEAHDGRAGERVGRGQVHRRRGAGRPADVRLGADVDHELDRVGRGGVRC